MASPTRTIHSAFESLQRSISLEHRHTFASTELQDVWNTVQDIQTAQRKRHSAQNLRRIEPLLQGLAKYAKFIEILCNGTQYSSFIWAPINLMIQLASNHRDIFDALLDAYADIGSALPRLDRYESTFKNNPEFQYVLAGIYSAILDFHQRTYKFFQRRAWHLIFLPHWTDFQARFKGILNTIEKHRDFIDKEAHSIDMVEDRAARSRILNDLEEKRRQMLVILESTEEQNRLVQIQSSISWLAVNDKKQETERTRRSIMKHPGTCEWIGNVSGMRSWLKNDESEPVIWLNGKPGAGKSVMCAFIIELLENLKEVNCCYYFCNNQDDGWDSSSERVLGVIATQLLRAHPELASLITNEFVARGMSSGLAQLRLLVRKMLELQPYTRIVVDGIDECSKSGQKSVLNELQATCLGPKIRCKILISSRKEPSIKAELEKKPTISLDENDKVESDIKLYVAHKIQLLQSNFMTESEPDLFNNIACTLTEKADGMFLWVKLITKELEQCYSRRDLEQCAQSLPHGLKEAYGRILDRMLDDEVPPHSRSLSIRILEWMACSYRRLKIHEILDGVSIWPDYTILDSDSKLHEKVLDLCKPLVEDGPSNTLVFVHFSAQEYILKAAYRHDKPFIRPEDAHLNIGFSCVAYLNSSFCLLWQNSSREERMHQVLLGLHGLQVYANQNWHKHIKAYMDLAVSQKLKLPEYLILQLEAILKYKKTKPAERSRRPVADGNSKGKNVPEQLPTFERIPGLSLLVSDLEEFRHGLKKQDWTRKSVEDISREICDSDPSWFSYTRHNYQVVLEDVLNPSSSTHPTGITKNDLQRFQNMYGDAAFTCRYPHCDRAADGFGSLQDREKHEAQHRREYRCDIPNCAYSELGFATRAQLNRHTRKYHSESAHGTTLADAVRNLKKRKLSVNDPASSVDSDSLVDHLTSGRNHLTESSKVNARKDRFEPSPLVLVETPELTAEEEHMKQEKELLFLRHKIQKRLLMRDQEPKEEDMKMVSEYMAELEGYADIDASLIKATKMNKVVKAILKIKSIPKELDFQFKPRSQMLLDKYNKILDSDLREEHSGIASATTEQAALKPLFYCSDPECERYTNPFPCAKDLEHHVQKEHARPLHNPPKYAQENLASTLHLDPHIQPEKAPTPQHPSRSTVSLDETISTPGNSHPLASRNQETTSQLNSRENGKAADWEALSGGTEIGKEQNSSNPRLNGNDSNISGDLDIFGPDDVTDADFSFFDELPQPDVIRPGISSDAFFTDFDGGYNDDDPNNPFFRTFDN